MYVYVSQPAAVPVWLSRVVTLGKLAGAGHEAAGLLREAPEALRADREVVIAAVAENGDALRHVLSVSRSLCLSQPLPSEASLSLSLSLSSPPR
eukprot:COSAG02_NODE_56175_length_286_cov_2.128342_1_plen_94_part_10